MTILVVEDERRLADALTEILTEVKYMVDTVYDGNDGLAYAESGIYDVIVLDVMLPGKNGFEIVSSLRKKKIATPVLMLTARGEVQDKIRGLDAGADDYMTKPFSPDDLLARIQQQADNFAKGRLMLNPFSEDDWDAFDRLFNLPVSVHDLEDGREAWEPCRETELREALLVALRDFCIAVARQAKKADCTEACTRFYLSIADLEECRGLCIAEGGLEKSRREGLLRNLYDGIRLYWGSAVVRNFDIFDATSDAELRLNGAPHWLVHEHATPAPPKPVPAKPRQPDSTPVSTAPAPKLASRLKSFIASVDFNTQTIYFKGREPLSKTTEPVVVSKTKRNVLWNLLCRLLTAEGHGWVTLDESERIWSGHFQRYVPGTDKTVIDPNNPIALLGYHIQSDKERGQHGETKIRLRKNARKDDYKRDLAKAAQQRTAFAK